MINVMGYDLEERTLEFGKRIIRMCKALPSNTINFKFKLGICLRESKETIYWLQLIIEANSELERRIEPLLKENRELVKIFAAILLKSK